MSDLKTFSDVIALWGTHAGLARQVGTVRITVTQWKRRDSIPERWWTPIVDAAARCGFEGVTYALLARMTPGAALTDRETPAPR